MRIGILTVSDRASQGVRSDLSGPALEEIVQSKGWSVTNFDIVPDDFQEIVDKLNSWADSNELDLILTTGGTGFSPRDITPEATLEVIDREAPGLVEAMRFESLKVTPHAMLSRARAGIRGHTLIVNLPGNPRAAVENLDVILPVVEHAIDLLSEDPSAEDGHHFGNNS